MKEPKSNIQFFCDGHAPKPSLSFSHRPLKSFVGKFVKKGFPAIHPELKKPTTEHMWVKVTAIEGQRLVGRLDNHPIFETELKCGDTVKLYRREIEQVME